MNSIYIVWDTAVGCVFEIFSSLERAKEFCREWDIKLSWDERYPEHRFIVKKWEVKE